MVKMGSYNILRLAEGVYWVGVKDWNRRLFDALIPLPYGTTYNSYLVIGEDKKALIDTVNPGFEEELDGKISQLIDLTEIDYVVMNHAEPDHAGAIPYIMRKNKKALLITTGVGSKMAQTFYKVSEERIKKVSDQELLDLGGKSFRFIEAPMLHWPETMFTYLEEDKILFPCDFFGSHLARGVYSDEVEDLLVHAQRYWGEIMMPFRTMAQRALEKLGDIEIRMIAPSHGPIYRKPEVILDAYRKWSNGETRRKAVIVYVTMWGSTERMIYQMSETLAEEGIEVALHNLAVTDIGDLARDLVDSKAIVLGAPTVLGGAHPLAVYATYLVKALRPPAKFAVVLSSYGWAGRAIRHIQEILGQFKIEVVDAVEVNGLPTKEDISRVIDAAKLLARKIRGEA